MKRWICFISSLYYNIRYIQTMPAILYLTVVFQPLLIISARIFAVNNITAIYIYIQVIIKHKCLVPTNNSIMTFYSQKMHNFFKSLKISGIWPITTRLTGCLSGLTWMHLDCITIIFLGLKIDFLCVTWMYLSIYLRFYIVCIQCAITSGGQFQFINIRNQPGSGPRAIDLEEKFGQTSVI